VREIFRSWLIGSSTVFVTTLSRTRHNWLLSNDTDWTLGLQDRAQNDTIRHPSAGTGTGLLESHARRHQMTWIGTKQHHTVQARYGIMELFVVGPHAVSTWCGPGDGGEKVGPTHRAGVEARTSFGSKNILASPERH
jgi:hypothetical protein